MPRKLTAKQTGFARDYVLLGNAREAYRRNYNAAKMKPQTINRKAQDLLNNGTVAALINKLQQQVVERAEKKFKIDVDWILNEAHQQYLRCTGKIKTDHCDLVDGVPLKYQAKQFNAHAANKALENIGNHIHVRAFDKTLHVDADGITLNLNYGG